MDSMTTFNVTRRIYRFKRPPFVPESEFGFESFASIPPWFWHVR
jgi:hypothetical protein